MGRNGPKQCCQIRTSGIGYEIRTNMNCLVRNVIYVIQCRSCGLTYIGETVNLRQRMSKHRFGCSSLANVSQEVSRHLWECGMGFVVCPLYKMKKESKIAHLVMEDKLIKLLKPDLNRDQSNLLQLI